MLGLALLPVSCHPGGGASASCMRAVLRSFILVLEQVLRRTMVAEQREELAPVGQTHFILIVSGKHGAVDMTRREVDGARWCLRTREDTMRGVARPQRLALTPSVHVRQRVEGARVTFSLDCCDRETFVCVWRTHLDEQEGVSCR